MRDLDDAPIERSETTVPLSPEPRRPPASPALTLVAGIALAALVAASAWYWLRRDRSPAPAQAGDAAASTSAAPEAPPAAEAVEPLPPLDASDDHVRALAARLSSHPRLAVWLAGEGLVRRYAAVVASLGEGTSPAGQLTTLRPAGAFEVRRSGGRIVADDASFRRYDLVTEVFVSLDTAGVASLHRRLGPLLEQAWREVGDPALSFDRALARALAPLLAVEIPDAPPELVPDGAVYLYARPDLEALSAVQKHLLRLGPENARRVQAKLRELAAALEADAAPRASH